jgi:hypothetical protein
MANATLAKVRDSNKIVLHGIEGTTEFIRQGTRWQAWDIERKGKDRFAAGKYSDTQVCMIVEDEVHLKGCVHYQR